MPENRIKPKDADVLQAVKDGVEDLDALQNELMGGERSYTSGERAMQVDYWGTRGATRKRQAEVEFLTGVGDSRATLRAAKADYEQGLQAGSSDHWILGQFIVLQSVLASAAKVKVGAPGRRRLGGDLPRRPARHGQWQPERADVGVVLAGRPAPGQPARRVAVARHRRLDQRADGPRGDGAGRRRSQSLRRGVADLPAVLAVEGLVAGSGLGRRRQRGYDYMWALVLPALDIQPARIRLPQPGVSAPRVATADTRFRGGAIVFC